MIDHKNEELSRLTSQMLDGVICEEDHKRLSTLLSESVINRKEYLELIRIESLLHWESEDIASPELSESNSNKKVLLPFPLWIGAAAAVFIAMSAIWWSLKPTQPDQGFAVHQTASSSIKLSPLNKPNLISREQIDKLNSTPLNNLNIPSSPDWNLNTKAIRAIENSLNHNIASSEGIVEYHGPVKQWSRQHKLLTPSENGILPASGSTMIGLESMNISVENQTAEVAETVQVLDIREAINKSPQNEARIFAAVKFNQSFGESQEGAEFGITLQAFKKEGDSIPRELLRSEQLLTSDRDPSTWDDLSSELIIPHDAEFLVVSLSARKHGPDSVLANTSSYYADDLQLYLAFDEQTTVGPI